MAWHDLRNGNGPLKPHVFLHSHIARLLFAWALIALPAIAHAGHITISWDPDPEPLTVGYRIHNARSGEAFATPIDVGNVSSYTFNGLDEATAYRAAVVAYDVLGQESPLSDVVVYNPKKDDPSGDTDQDGLPDALEIAGCTDPNDADSDEDGLADGTEDANRDGVQDTGETSACAADTDGDGLQDGTELSLTAPLAAPPTDLAAFRPDLDPATTTDPLSADTDGDGLADGREDIDANGRVDSGETDPLVADNPLIFADTFSDGTSAGDPSWRKVRGAWSVTGAAKRFASTTAPVSMALVADPALTDFRSGRIETSAILSRSCTKLPDARIVFHYQDASHYRYVQLTTTGISLGQVGSNPIEKAGVKATARRRFKINAVNRLRLDVKDGTDVKVYLNGGRSPILSHRFTVSSSGRLGYRTEGARSLFDNTGVYTDAVLQ